MAPLPTAKVATERLPVKNRARDHGLRHAPHAPHAAPRLLTAAELADYDRLGYILRSPRASELFRRRLAYSV